MPVCRRRVAIVALVVLLTACTEQGARRSTTSSAAATPSRQDASVIALLSYEPPSDYVLVAELGGGEGVHGLFQVTVVKHAKERVVELDPTGQAVRNDPAPSPELVPTIKQIQDYVRDTLARGGQVTAVIVDDDGRPVMVALDPLPEAIDDEATYRIERFDPDGGSG